MVELEDMIDGASDEIEENTEPECLFKFLEPLDRNPIRAVSPDGIRGSILQHEDGQQWDRDMVEHFMDQGFVTNMAGDICSALAVPCEIVQLPNGHTSVMVDSNLSASRQGLFWMLDPHESHMSCDDGPQRVFQCLTELAYAIDALSEMEHCCLKVWDGHQLFFNLDYGITTFVLDGADMVSHGSWIESSDPKQYANDALAAALLYALTGAWPDRENAPEGIPETGERLFFTAGNPEPDGSEAILARWDALPEKLRNAFVSANTHPIAGYISAMEWAQLLSQDFQITQKCVFCGHIHLDDVRRCPFCGREVNKKDLWVRMLVRSNSDGAAFAVSFGRGLVLTGSNFSTSLPQGPLMRLIYNSKLNILGLRNLGSTKWLVQDSNGSRTIVPGAILELSEELKIDPDQTGTVCLEFQTYEAPGT